MVSASVEAVGTITIGASLPPASSMNLAITSGGLSPPPISTRWPRPSAAPAPAARSRPEQDDR